MTALTVKSQVSCDSTSAWSPKWSPSASTPSTVSSPYLPVPILLTLPWAIRKTWSAGWPALDDHLAGRELPLDEPVGQRAQHLVVVEAAQQRQLAQLRGDDPDLGRRRW